MAKGEDWQGRVKEGSLQDGRKTREVSFSKGSQITISRYGKQQT